MLFLFLGFIKLNFDRITRLKDLQGCGLKMDSITGLQDLQDRLLGLS